MQAKKYIDRDENPAGVSRHPPPLVLIPGYFERPRSVRHLAVAGAPSSALQSTIPPHTARRNWRESYDFSVACAVAFLGAQRLVIAACHLAQAQNPNQMIACLASGLKYLEGYRYLPDLQDIQHAPHRQVQRRQACVACQGFRKSPRSCCPNRVPTQVERSKRAVLVETPCKARRTLVRDAVEP